jgi:GGDEF domain-containing protein
VSEKSSRLNQLAIQAGRRVCGKDVISLSVGTSFCPEDGFDVERLLAEADRKMYTMKQVHHALAEQAGAVRNVELQWNVVN